MPGAGDGLCPGGLRRDSPRAGTLLPREGWVILTTALPLLPMVLMPASPRAGAPRACYSGSRTSDGTQISSSFVAPSWSAPNWLLTKMPGIFWNFSWNSPVAHEVVEASGRKVDREGDTHEVAVVGLGLDLEYDAVTGPADQSRERLARLQVGRKRCIHRVALRDGANGSALREEIAGGEQAPARVPAGRVAGVPGLARDRDGAGARAGPGDVGRRAAAHKVCAVANDIARLPVIRALAGDGLRPRGGRPWTLPNGTGHVNWTKGP